MNKYYIVYHYEIGKRIKKGACQLFLKEEINDMDVIMPLAAEINKIIPNANENSVIIESWVKLPYLTVFDTWKRLKVWLGITKKHIPEFKGSANSELRSV